VTRVATRQQPEAEVGINTYKNFQILNIKKNIIGRLSLLPETFGKVVVEGTMFFYIESVKFDPQTS
jgi:hypothetical protein